MLLLLDNYDSFTYNLYQYIRELYDEDVLVVRNDAISLAALKQLRPAALVLSPGPGSPGQAGICIPLVAEFSGTIPILGVCLGHQAIAEAFGAVIGQANTPVHGKRSFIRHSQQGLFRALPSPYAVVRYHSLAVEQASIPPCLSIEALAEDNTIMAIAHKVHPTFGVQFHPESLLSEYGKELLHNFLCWEVHSNA